MINVSRTVLPSFEEYSAILQRAWKKGWITNNGELVQELENSLRQYLNTPFLWYAANGTLVLQMALKALQAKPGDEIITTPFSYVATANVIAWEQLKPVFADVDMETCCISPEAIESAITTRTRAILATHVYGMPCDVAAIEAIANKHGLVVIYDGAHCFGVQYKGKALLNYGDIATCSFHATKIFHTVEGGCVIAKDEKMARQFHLYRQFGHVGEEYFEVGINAKNSEVHAAMGLALLPKVDAFITERRLLFAEYKRLLQGSGLRWLQPDAIEGLQWNYSYFPLFFANEQQTLQVRAALQAAQIFPRRYFHPSLNILPFYGDYQSCPVSEQLAATVLCLPFFNGLTKADQERIVNIILQHI